jgi:chromosome segregation ATPase
MSLIGAPSLDEVLRKEVEKFEKEINAQHFRALRLQAKNDACETQQGALQINLEKAQKEIADWVKKHGGLSAQPAFDKTSNDLMKDIAKIQNEIMKMDGKCGISKRNMKAARAIKEGMETALKEFKRRHRLP